MTALYIIIGIAVFFVSVLSIPIILDLEYTDFFKCSVSWLFLKFSIYPSDDKKKKPKKKKKPEKNKPEGPKKEEVTKEKKDNIIKTFYNNRGVLGIIEFVNNCASALMKFSKGLLRSFYIRKLYIDISVTKSDAARTAIYYGKVCQKLYPALGFICSSCHVKNYKVNVRADYCGEKSQGQLITKVAFIPRKTINAGIAMVARLGLQLIKVVLSNRKYIKKKNINLKGGTEE